MVERSENQHFNLTQKISILKENNLEVSTSISNSDLIILSMIFT